MPTKLYDWKRYWIPREKEPPLDDAGFLQDPAETSDSWWSHTNDAVGFDSLVQSPCLVLLGEPGMGKSSTLKSAAALTEKAVEGTAAQVLHCDLGPFNTDSGVVNDIFESEEFVAWRNHRRPLYLFLDSLDECRISIPGVARLLGSKLGRLPDTNGLFLRIACRVGDWPESLESTLSEKWGNDVPKTLILAPLTRAQVAQAARDEGKDADAFVKAVISRELVAFARSPLTLRFLLSSWSKLDGELPRSLREIYEEGCKELCLDPCGRTQHQSRLDASSDERMAIASHIAAGLIFTGRQAVWANRSEVNRPPGTVSIAELTDHRVTTKQGVVPVTETALRVVLDSGLFTSQGPDLYTWAHKAFAEFLAARSLEQDGLKPNQILDFLTSRVDGEGKLVPQLHQTAAWAAKPHTDLFKHLLRTQPDILLGGDLAVTDDSTKEQVFRAVIDAIEGNRLSEGTWTFHDRWHKLKFPGMAAILRERLIDTHLDPYTRETVVHVITAEGCQELLPDLLRITLDTEENLRVRRFAAEAVVKLGDPNHFRELRPLALGQAGPDPDQALQGIALAVCWPAHLSAEELFQSLDDVSLDSDFRYRSFLAGNWPTALNAEEMVHGLNWIGALKLEDDYEGGTLRSLLVRLLDASVSHLNNGTVLHALVGAIIQRSLRNDRFWQERESSLGKRLTENLSLRHRMTEIALKIMPAPLENAWFLTYGGLSVVRSEDMPWLVGQMAEESQPIPRQALGMLVQRTFEGWNTVHVATLLAAYANDPSIEDLCPLLLKPVEVNSSQAARLRRNFELNQWEPKPATEQIQRFVPTPADVEQALHQFEEGDLTRWPHVCKLLATDGSGKIKEFGATWDLRKLNHWTSLSSPGIARLEKAADAYIRAKAVAVGPWFSGNAGYPYDLIAGLQALVLLQTNACDQLSRLPAAIWAKWLPAILRISEYGSGESQKRLVEAAFKYAPDAAEEWMVKSIEAAIAEKSGFAILAWIPASIRPSLSQSLLHLIQSESTDPSCVYWMAELLWQRQLPGLADWVGSYLRSMDVSDPQQVERSLKLCEMLIRKAEATQWPQIRSVMERLEELGRPIFETMAQQGYLSRLPAILLGVDEREVAWLWEWSIKHYPISAYPAKHGSGVVSPEEQFAGLRDLLLIHLGNIGTSAGCAELSRLAAFYPAFSWIRQLEQKAFAKRRANEWEPIDPKLLFEMARKPRSRWVESEEQLLEVIIESLMEFERRLHGPTPLADLLWNKSRPKQEESVSNWIASELRRDLSTNGIVLNREVVIRPTDRADILVETNCRDAKTDQFRPIRVIIEVKRDFNPDIEHAMKTQLSERYLEENDCKTGLYLVAWFDRNRQRGDKAQERLKEFRARLETQAARESCAGKNLRAWVLDCCRLKPSKQVTARKTAKSPKPGKPTQNGRGKRGGSAK